MQEKSARADKGQRWIYRESNMILIKRWVLPLALAFSVVFTFCVSCSEKPENHKAEDTKQKRIPMGALMDESISFQYAVYYLPLPTNDPLIVLHQLLDEQEDAPTFASEMQKKTSKRLVRGYPLEEVKTEYPPPDRQSLQYFGRGITLDQAEQLQKSRLVFIMNFAHDKAHVWRGLRTANAIAEALARKTGGLLWDEQTHEVFTPDEWHRKRIQAWTNGIPDLSNHITIHAYKSDEYVRAITLGMAKFGLPDVVVDGFSWSLNRTMGHLINLFCQDMAEGAVISTPGQYDLDIRKIQNKQVRDPQVNALKSNATAVARLALREGKWEEGDPRNRLIEIAFDRYPGRDVHAKQEKLLTSLFGWEDAVAPVKHNEELLAASRRAKTKLPMLRKAFAEGLNPGEFIQVKVPFRTHDGGREWMWVEITAWDGNNIKGLLKNEPFNIPSLHGGQIVEVKQADVFDYIRRHPDGRQEGNETGAIIQKMQQTTAGK
jgi:uncharacterized protein YegJ (DUF2314 family)